MKRREEERKRERKSKGVEEKSIYNHWEKE